MEEKKTGDWRVSNIQNVCSTSHFLNSEAYVGQLAKILTWKPAKNRPELLAIKQCWRGEDPSDFSSKSKRDMTLEKGWPKEDSVLSKQMPSLKSANWIKVTSLCSLNLLNRKWVDPLWYGKKKSLSFIAFIIEENLE